MPPARSLLRRGIAPAVLLLVLGGAGCGGGEDPAHPPTQAESGVGAHEAADPGAGASAGEDPGAGGDGPPAAPAGDAAQQGGDPREPAVLVVKVLFDPTGEPVPDVPYDIISQVEGELARTRATTGPDGLDGTRFDHGQQINAVVVRSTVFTAPKRVEVNEILVGGERHEVVVRVRPAAAVAGVVLDGLGQPVPGAQINVFFRSVHRLDQEYRPQVDLYGTSDEQGRFRIGGMPAGVFTVEAAVEEMVNVQRVAGAVEEGEVIEGIELFMEPAHAVYGQVLGPDEEAVEGARVVAGEPGRRRRRHPTEHERLFRYPPRQIIEFSDEQGLFTLYGVPDARHWNLNVRHEDYLPWVGTLPPGKVDVWVELEEGVSLRGSVVDEEGEALPGARMWLFLAGGARTTVSGREDGEFGFAGLDPETAALLLVHAPGRQMTLVGPLELIDGAHERDVVLPPGLVLEGRVVDDEGAPVDAARVRIQGEPPSPAVLPEQMPEQVLERAVVMTGADGRFRFEDLYPGPFTLTVTAPGGRRAVVADVAAGGDPRTVVLE